MKDIKMYKRLGNIDCNKNYCEANKTLQNPKTNRRQSAPKATSTTKQQS